MCGKANPIIAGYVLIWYYMNMTFTCETCPHATHVNTRAADYQRIVETLPAARDALINSGFELGVIDLEAQGAPEEIIEFQNNAVEATALVSLRTGSMLTAIQECLPLLDEEACDIPEDDKRSQCRKFLATMATDKYLKTLLD
jgi:hypothetical protein